MPGACCALDEDLTDFHARCRQLDLLRPVAEVGAGRLLRSPDLWEDAVKGICTTNVTWQRTQSMVAALTTLGPRARRRKQRRLPYA